MSPLLGDVLVALVAALVAGLVAIWSNAWLSRRNRRSDQRVSFLLKSYEDFEFNSNRDVIPNPDDFEKAAASIRLLGTPKQVELVEVIMDQIAQNGSADNTELLSELRQELRSELGLEQVPVTHKYLRLVRKPGAPQ